jgi:hypothetical protein
MSTTAVIIQPHFLPWRGYFDLFSRGNHAIYLDNVQYVRRSWGNRNKIFQNNNSKWITVPVQTKGSYRANIDSIKINDSEPWRKSLLSAVRHAYSKAPFFQPYFDEFEKLISREWDLLSDLNIAAIEWGFQTLNRPMTLVRASNLDLKCAEPVGRLIEICQIVGANKYISGPSAKDYIGEGDAFKDQNIELEWMEYDYSPYPHFKMEGGQCKVPFSIIDLIFNVGPDAESYIWPR